MVITSQPTTLWGRFWRSAPLRFFGKYSYAMYVFQKPLVDLLYPWFSPEMLCRQLDSVLLGRLVYLAIMLVATTLVREALFGA
jgi:peptidoglycan/LPS O-acetylase OafA/YrhL